MKLEEVKIKDGKEGYELSKYELFYIDGSTRTSVIKYEKGELDANWNDLSEDKRVYIYSDLKVENDIIKVLLTICRTSYKSDESWSQMLFISKDDGKTFSYVPKDSDITW